MKNHFIIEHICALGALFILASGCTKTPVSATTPPAKVTIPDKQLLLEISRQAIATRLPDMAFDDLELRDVAYRWYIDDLDQYTNEQFNIGFRVKDSKRKVAENGEAVFKIDTVGVNVELDGQIGRGGVNKGTETFRSENESILGHYSSQGGPVWGDPFYPVKLNLPPPCPNRHDLAGIGLRAIHRFLPSVETADLVLRSADFVDMKRPEQKVDYVGFSTTFWLSSSIRTNITQHEVIVSREEITVNISTNGQVAANGVRKSPGSRSYNRDALPDTWRPPVETTSGN